jgi:hypothetical protein
VGAGKSFTGKRNVWRTRRTVKKNKQLIIARHSGAGRNLNPNHSDNQENCSFSTENTCGTVSTTGGMPC